ncbi:xylulokinase [Treponema sp.]|uniref:xylulokinase n=1 Tax=Treponema sp. TaxID=166 RepID=UPI003F11FA85
MKTVAGIDLGTQSMKVVLYDYEAKKTVESSSFPLELISGADGSREQKAEWYRAALESCFLKLSAEGKSSIQSIGVSGQQHGFVPLDSQGNPLYNIKLWNDTSTAEECRLIADSVGGQEAAAAEVQNFILPGFTAPKILWLKRHQPQLFEKLRYIMLPHDYLNFLLTGNYVMEQGDSSGTALFSSKEKKWSEKLCAAVDPELIKKLPPVIAPDEPAGFVSREAAGWLGIPEGAVVSSGGGDNMMSAIGTGTVKNGVLAMSMGTSGTLYGFSSTSISDPAAGISGFCASSGGYLPLLCTMNCTVASEEIRGLLNLGVKEFDAEAEKADPCAGGVFVLPFFNGERTPNLPHGKASITGLTAQNCSRSNIARAALESAVYAMKTGLDSFRKHGFTPSELRLTGGGAKSALWRQITADIMNLPVRIPVLQEAAAFGAALQALWCLSKLQKNPVSMESLAEIHVEMDSSKTARPDEKRVQEYNRAFSEYQSLVEHLAPLYR